MSPEKVFTLIAIVASIGPACGYVVFLALQRRFSRACDGCGDRATSALCGRCVRAIPTEESKGLRAEVEHQREQMRDLLVRDEKLGRELREARENLAMQEETCPVCEGTGRTYTYHSGTRNIHTTFACVRCDATGKIRAGGEEAHAREHELTLKLAAKTAEVARVAEIADDWRRAAEAPRAVDFPHDVRITPAGIEALRAGLSPDYPVIHVGRSFGRDRAEQGYVGHVPACHVAEIAGLRLSFSFDEPSVVEIDAPKAGDPAYLIPVRITPKSKEGAS